MGPVPPPWMILLFISQGGLLDRRNNYRAYTDQADCNLIYANIDVT